MKPDITKYVCCIVLAVLLGEIHCTAQNAESPIKISALDIQGSISNAQKALTETQLKNPTVIYALNKAKENAVTTATQTQNPQTNTATQTKSSMDIAKESGMAILANTQNGINTATNTLATASEHVQSSISDAASQAQNSISNAASDVKDSITNALSAVESTVSGNRERTIKKINIKNKTMFEVRCVRQIEPLSVKAGFSKSFKTGSYGFKEAVIVKGSPSLDKNALEAIDKNPVTIDAHPLIDHNEEDIREYSIHIKDTTAPKEKEPWIEVGRFVVAISCNRAVIGVINASQYNNPDAVNRFDNFSGTCGNALYNRHEGDIYAHHKDMWGEDGRFMIPRTERPSSVTLSDGSVLTYALRAELMGNFEAVTFFVTQKSVAAPTPGSPCVKENRPGTLGADRECHWIYCELPDGKPGFKDANNKCTSIGCNLPTGIDGLIGRNEQCMAVAGLPCSTKDIANGETDAQGNCVQLKGSECIVPNSHGSAGFIDQTGTCIGRTDAPCMNAAGLGGVWNSDGKTCTPKTGARCYNPNTKQEGTMTSESTCGKTKGASCINEGLSATGTFNEKGECTVSEGSECLTFDGKQGHVGKEGNLFVCKPLTEPVVAGQECIDPKTKALGTIESDKKTCTPKKDSICIHEGKEGIIHGAVCQTEGTISSTISQTTTHSQKSHSISRNTNPKGSNKRSNKNSLGRGSNTKK